MPGFDFKKYSGLALTYDSGSLVFQEGGINFALKHVAKISDMRPQLLNPDLTCPVLFYTIFSGIDRKSLLKRKNLVFDLVVMPQNLAGIEYVKTKGIRMGQYPVLVEVIQGFCTVVIQSSAYDSMGEGVQSMVVKLRRGEKFVIPPSMDFVLVNSRQCLSATALFYSSKARRLSVFDTSRGCAHYVIRKNARQEVVQNPNFRKVNKMKAPRPEALYRYFALTARTPVFKQILRKYDRFRWLHDSSKIDWKRIPNCP